MNTDVIRVKHSSIIIPNYELGSNANIERMLSVYNRSYFRFEPVGYYYNEETRELRLPRGLDLNYLERQFQRPIQMEYEANEFDPASIRLKVEPRSDIQRKSISYLLGEGKFEYTKKFSQLALDLDTGDGKTYCVIAALTFMKMKSMVVTHSDGIKEQWKSSFLRMTDIDEGQILDISGSAVIRTLLKTTKKIPYKVFLVNHQSLQSFAKKEGWDKVEELFKKLKIGVKVFDEAHLRFENLIKVDMHSNVKKTIYLTANFERSDFREDKVYSLCFKNIPLYGRETRKEKRKHIVYMSVFYNSKPTIAERAVIKGRYGFDKNKYIDYQVENDIFYNVIKYVLDKFNEQEGKILMLFTKNDAIDRVHEYLTNEFKTERSIAIYNSLVSDEEKQKALTADLILSTPKSLGTGSDIPGLRFNIVTEQYSSAVSANQYSGRLREYADDKFTFHVELIDEGFPEAVSMYKKRLPVFKKGKCVQLLELRYTE